MSTIASHAPDPRPPWQIAAAVRLQSAVNYLRLLDLDEHKRQVYETIYKVGDLEQWINEHVKTLIDNVNRSVEEHGQSFGVPSVAASWSDALRARGLSGTVEIVGGIRIEGGTE